MYRLKKLDEPILNTDYWYNTGWCLSYPAAQELVNEDSGRKQISEKEWSNRIVNNLAPVSEIRFIIGQGKLTESYYHLFIYEKITKTPRGNKRL